MYNARATRFVIHSYLYSGLRPWVRGKITSDNGNLRNLCYLSREFGINNLRVSVTDYPNRAVETTFLALF